MISFWRKFVDEWHAPPPPQNATWMPLFKGIFVAAGTIWGTFMWNANVNFSLGQSNHVSGLLTKLQMRHLIFDLVPNDMIWLNNYEEKKNTMHIWGWWIMVGDILHAQLVRCRLDRGLAWQCNIVTISQVLNAALFGWIEIILMLLTAYFTLWLLFTQG